jgi:hypothetical protein
VPGHLTRARRLESGAGFSAAMALVFGLFSWLQFPTLCGFMFSSTRAGADNYRYSLALGALLALVGFLSGLGTLVRGPRAAMLIAGMALSVSFVVAALAVPDWFGVSCHALYTDVSNE